jgi:hypothetical protein
MSNHEKPNPNLRYATSVRAFPWKEPLVTLLWVAVAAFRDYEPVVEQAKTLGEKRSMVERFVGADTVTRGRLLACWPGRLGQDVFSVGDGKALENLQDAVAPATVTVKVRASDLRLAAVALQRRGQVDAGVRLREALGAEAEAEDY